ncbi:MAG: PIN domain-containing protein [Bryobacterales bacterium]|nr:PIN domain-containing protein [Bryobacterales bacterium]
MSPVVLDTDVVSFLFKGDSRAQLFLPYLHNRTWLVSFMTEAELEQWALLANWSPKRIEWLRIFLTRVVVVPSSRDLVLKWAGAMVRARHAGRRLETADGWIAATALLYDAPLLTHNRSDYVGVPNLKFQESME